MADFTSRYLWEWLQIHVRRSPVWMLLESLYAVLGMQDFDLLLEFDLLDPASVLLTILPDLIL